MIPTFPLTVPTLPPAAGWKQAGPFARASGGVEARA